MMTTRKSWRQCGALYLLCLGAIVAAASCVFDTSGLAPSGWRVWCDVPVWDCPKTSTPPNFTVTGPHPNVSKYLTRDNFWKIKGAAYQVYWHPQIYVANPGPPELPGATMIMTGGADWKVPDAAFMTITLKEEVDGIYVAYDSRANPKPAWLRDTSKYQRLSKSLAITMPDHNFSPPQLLMLDVYRAKNVTAKDAKLVLPGNNHGAPGWSKVATGNPAMYVVFVKPKPTPDCSKGKFKTSHHVDDCYGVGPDQETQAMAAASSAATAECQAAYPNDVCQTPVCSNAGWEKECEVDNTIYGCTFCKAIDGGFGHNSEVAFSAASSTASGTVADTSFNSAITGELLFTYKTNALGAMDVMRVNRMGLDIEAFGTEVGEFTEVKVTLKAPTAAKCMDSPAPVATPCSRYQIPAGEFWCLESCRLDGDPVAFASNSNAPIDINLDTVTHTFTITGSLQSTAEVDGEPFDIDVTLNLVGQVVNYAPKAAAGFEGDDIAECSDAVNESAVYLYAGQSFDVDDGSLPGSSFEWYEDKGLVTETHWGTGTTVTIGVGQLGYGEHNITLLVTDSQGVLDSDTIVVTVADTTPPVLEVPEDVEIFTAASLPTLVQIGEAYASDKCLPLPEDAITNDAPEDMRFEAGETLVTWRAEDGSGNVATGVQRVVVNALSGPGSLLDAIRDGIIQLQEAVEQSHADISQCGPAEAPCPIDLGALLELMEVLIGNTHDAADQAGEDAEQYEALLGTLEAVRMHLVEAAGALEESNHAEGPDAALRMREQCLDNLMAANGLLDDAAQQVEAMESDPEPADDGGPDADGDDRSNTTGQPRGGARRNSLCGFGAAMFLFVCAPLLMAWKVYRRR